MLYEDITIVGSPARLKKIAEDLVFHYEERNNNGIEGKAMIVSMSRQIAVNLYNEIIKIRPHWHSDELDQGMIKVVITSYSIHYTKLYESGWSRGIGFKLRWAA